MIYLIDDKKSRQIGYGWTDAKLSSYSTIIKPIYTYEEIKEKELRNEIFSDGSTVLFHESFFDGIKNTHKQDAIEISNNLEEYAKTHPDFYLAKFSGSKNSRTINSNIIHLPVSVLYQNLEIFSQKLKQDHLDLRYLLFGENYLIEETLISELNKANNNIDKLPQYETTSKNLFIRPSKDNIQKPLHKEYTEQIIFKKVTDEDLNIKINDWFLKEEYDNIFIPLCFGPILSDFNGLRLAIHIRCTDTPNRLKNIFLYGFVDHSYLINNEYYDILKTKNVQLINYSKSAFQKAVETPLKKLTENELPSEIKKIKLDPPANYEDSHSIANEWAIYRWANAIDAEDDDIEKIIYKVNNQLYFKYLSTIFPVKDIPHISKNQLKIKHSGNPKILYIDDEAEKGWYEIFCTVLEDINELGFEYLDEEFNTKTQNEIIDLSLDKIKKDDIDIVILDFRLHPNDFNISNLQEVTGLKLLKKIKLLNPGIQVIIFSATNKIWNLQALQDAGADGFIVKESPENSVDNEFTKYSIISFCKTIEKSLEKSFLKSFYKDLETLNKHLIPRKNYKKSNNPLPKEFVDEALKWLELSCDILRKDINDTNLTTSFLFMFSVIEILSNQVIDIDNPIMEEKSHSEIKYKWEFRKNNTRLKYFIKDEENLDLFRRSNSVFVINKRNLPWSIKILNTLYFISGDNSSETGISNLIKIRNDIIHANATTGDKINIEQDKIINLFSIIKRGLSGI